MPATMPVSLKACTASGVLIASQNAEPPALTVRQVITTSGMTTSRPT